MELKTLGDLRSISKYHTDECPLFPSIDFKYEYDDELGGYISLSSDSQKQPKDIWIVIFPHDYAIAEAIICYSEEEAKREIEIMREEDHDKAHYALIEHQQI